MGLLRWLFSPTCEKVDHGKEAYRLERQAIQSRKEKQYIESFRLDANAFHHMRLYEVELRNQAVNDSKRALAINAITEQQYRKQLKEANEFLQSWSNKSAVMRQVGVSMRKLKLDEKTQKKTAAWLIAWSHRGGNSAELAEFIKTLQTAG